MMKEGNSSKKWFQLANYRCTLDASVRQNLSSYEADSQDSIRCVKNDPIQCEIYCIISERVGFQIEWFWDLGHITWFTAWFPQAPKKSALLHFLSAVPVKWPFCSTLCAVSKWMTNSQSSPKEQGKDQNRLKQKKKSHTHTHTHKC
jgi:hypothetical protein